MPPSDVVKCLGTGEHTAVESKPWWTMNLRDARRTRSRAHQGRSPVPRIMGLTASAQWVFRVVVRPWLLCDSPCSCLNSRDCCSYLVPCLTLCFGNVEGRGLFFKSVWVFRFPWVASSHGIETITGWNREEHFVFFYKLITKRMLPISLNYI